MEAIGRGETLLRDGKAKGRGTLRAAVDWIHGRPEFLRVVITAAIGTVLAWITYEIVHFLNPFEPRASVSWAIAFLIGIVRQHHLHRTLSFPRNHVPYGTSLFRESVVSVGLFAVSTAGNFYLTERLGLHHRAAWATCLAGVAMFEYLLMKFFIFRRLARNIDACPDEDGQTSGIGR